MSRIKVGDLVGVDGGKGYNHGCSDYAIVKVTNTSPLEGTVVEGMTCHSCWQVGHDAGHHFAQVGDVWCFGENDRIVPASASSWAVSVKWELL